MCMSLEMIAKGLRSLTEGPNLGKANAQFALTIQKSFKSQQRAAIPFAANAFSASMKEFNKGSHVHFAVNRLQRCLNLFQTTNSQLKQGPK